MRLIIANICCMIYYVLSGIEIFPSIVRIIKRKSATDYSLLGTVFTFVGTICWSLYIFLTEQTIFVCIGTITDLFTVILYTIVVFLYHKRG